MFALVFIRNSERSQFLGVGNISQVFHNLKDWCFILGKSCSVGGLKDDPGQKYP